METTPIFGFQKPTSYDPADLRIFVGENMDMIEDAISTRLTIPSADSRYASIVHQHSWDEVTGKPTLYTGWKINANGVTDTISNLQTLNVSATGFSSVSYVASTNTLTINTSISGNLDMNNFNILNVNSLTFNDAGRNEGIAWKGSNYWQIFESPDDLTNASGNIQFTIGETPSRIATIKTDGTFEVLGTSPKFILTNSTSGLSSTIDYVDDALELKYQGETNLRLKTGGYTEVYGNTAIVKGSPTLWFVVPNRPNNSRIIWNASDVADYGMSFRVDGKDILHLTSDGLTRTYGNLLTAGDLTVEGGAYVAGYMHIMGWDLRLGYGDTDRGDSGSSRALVKSSGNILTVNYGQDFTGGTEIGGGIGSILNYKSHGPLSMSNGWVNYGSSYDNLAYTKLATGLVVLKGLIKSGSGFIATLPVGCRPWNRRIFMCYCSGGEARVDVHSDGWIELVSGGNGYVSLSNISFFAER